VENRLKPGFSFVRLSAAGRILAAARKNAQTVKIPKVLGME
jgi:hypothetical protein